MRQTLMCALIVAMGAHAAVESGAPDARSVRVGVESGAPDARSVRVGVESKPQTYKGLEVTVAAVTRATNVSLSDCPPGANTQRGVIKPGDATEFAAITVDFKVLPAYKAGAIPKPTLTGEGGKVFNTAQSFGDVAATPAFSCTFAFRVPKGAKVTKFTLDTASFDLTGLEK